MDSLLDQIKPIIYVPREIHSSWNLTRVLYEKFTNYYVLWFHWPHDGVLSHDSLGLRHEDYEPVILVHNNSNLTRIGLRPGNKYVKSDNWSLETGHAVIIFVTPWHHPEVDNDISLQRFHKSTSIRNSVYEPILGTPESWFIQADSNMTVYAYAQSLLNV